MIARRSLLALLGSLPFVGRAIAEARTEVKPEPVGLVVKDPYSEKVAVMDCGPLIFDREGVESGYARPGDFYLDAPSGRYFVGVAKNSGVKGDLPSTEKHSLVWVEIGRQA